MTLMTLKLTLNGKKIVTWDCNLQNLDHRPACYYCRHLCKVVRLSSIQFESRLKHVIGGPLVLHSFIHSGHFYSSPSSPLLLRGAPDYSTDTVSEFHAGAHRQM